MTAPNPRLRCDTVVGGQVSVVSQKNLTADNWYGDDRDRTDDPLLAKQVLSQLSYAPSYQ
jgi:hypothetical protein